MGGGALVYIALEMVSNLLLEFVGRVFHLLADFIRKLLTDLQ